MRAGIKTGLKNYKEIIPKTKAPVCEVYFRIDQKNQYAELFRMLQDRGIESGLHFWGFLTGNIMYNLAYPDEKIKNESLSLIKETIDIAHEFKQCYVNVHPGYYHLVGIDLDKYIFIDHVKTIPAKEGKTVLFENIKILHNYALKRNVIFLTETLTCRENLNWHDDNERNAPANLHSVPVTTTIELAKAGYFITNDFGHTLCDEINTDTDYLYNQLIDKTKQLAKQTKLIHTNTTKPPFTGVDTHNGITAEDFSQNVIPTKKQLIELLKIFKNRNDVWLIPEPLNNHEQNFIELDFMVKEIENKS